MNAMQLHRAYRAKQAAPSNDLNRPRPKITRIDFEDISIRIGAPAGSTWAVRKWAEGWTANTPACDVTGNPTMKNGQPFDIETALAQLEAAGWTVFRWQRGARAWRGRPEPVRDRTRILRLRRTIEERRRNGDLENVNPNLDLALWY